MIQTWRFDTPSQTMVLASFGGLPEVVYWSAPLPEDENLVTLTAASRAAPTGGMLDATAPLTVGLGGPGFMGHPSLGPHFPVGNFEWTGHGLRFANPTASLAYTLNVETFPDTDMIVLRAEVENLGAEPIAFDWIAAPVLPAPASGSIISFHGRWCGEFRMERRDWVPGQQGGESREGRTSHTSFPGILLPGFGTTETQGEAHGLHLGWSGGHRWLAEELPDGRRKIQMGVLAIGGHTIPPGETYATPPLYVTRSGEGLNGVSQAFHTHLRNHILHFAHSDRPRPVHYNCWEAVYFDHDLDTLRDLADRAAALGVERFVLDDGWFKGRNDDTSSLGDWVVDPYKWPHGLAPLIDHVTNIGMSFGLWVEPEMVSEESELFRRHPDWVYGPPDQVRGRNQLALDLAKPEVADYLFEQIDALLFENPIEYLKWDHNRALPMADGAQVPALYALFDRIRAAHPMVEIETCASGGGRIDFGILAHTQRMWLSDSNDALERVRIQRGASYFFPAEITGSHVGPRVCHTSGRTLPMQFRAGVAGSRSMGLEMDLRELTPAEEEEIRRAIDHYKARRTMLQDARLHRLESSDPAVLAELHIAADGSAFVLFSAQTAASDQQLARPLRLAGLDAAARYRVRLENPGDVPNVLNRGPRNPLVAGEPVTLSGTALMQLGLQLPNAFPNTIWTVNGECL